MTKHQRLTSAMLRAAIESIRISVLWASAVAKYVGIHPTDLFAVAYLLGTETASAGELMEVTGLTSGATTAMIDRLERARVVRRKRDPKDARRIAVQLLRPPDTVEFIRNITNKELMGAFSSADDATLIQAFSLQQKTNEALKRVVARFREERG